MTDNKQLVSTQLAPMQQLQYIFLRKEPQPAETTQSRKEDHVHLQGALHNVALTLGKLPLAKARKFTNAPTHVSTKATLNLKAYRLIRPRANPSKATGCAHTRAWQHLRSALHDEYDSHEQSVPSDGAPQTASSMRS
jgi:hypothetical protein